MIAESALRASEAQLASIIDSAMDAIIIADDNQRIIRFNRAAEDVFQYTAAQVIGQPLGVLMPERFRATHRAHVEQFGHTGIAKRSKQNLGALVGRRADGSEFPIEASIAQFQTNGRRFFTAIVRDIGLRVRADRAVRESEEQYRLLFQSNPNPMWVYDQATLAFLAVNNAAISHYGYTRAEFLALTIKDIRPPADVPALVQTVTQARADFARPRRWQHIKKDGTIIAVEISVHDLMFAGRAARVVLAIDVTAQQRAEHELQKRADEFAALYETTRDLAAHRDLTILLQTIIERATTLLATPNGTICLYDAARDDLEIVAARGSEMPPGTRLELGEGMAGTVAQTREPVVVENYSTWEHRSQKYADTLFSAGVAVPMLYGGELIGTLNLIESPGSTRTFSDADARLLALFAAQAASAVHNTRLFAQSQQRLARLAALHEIDRAITSTLGLTERLNLVLHHTRAQLRADIANVLLLDATGATLRQAARLGVESAPAWRDFTLRVGEGAAGWVAAQGKPLAIPDVTQDARWLDRDSSRIEGIVAFLGVPLSVDDQVIGVLGVATRARREFTPEEIEFLTTLAGQAAIAIQNARLFAETRQRLSELEAVNRVSTALRAAQTLDEMLPSLLDETLAVLGTNAGVIWLRDQAHGDLRHSVARGWIDRMTKTPIPPGEGIAGKVLVTGQAYRAREFASDPQTRESARREILPGWGGVCVPIRTAQEIVGVMFAVVPLPRELTDAEVHLLTTLAEIAGSAIQRTHLHEALEESYVETVLALAKTVDARDSYTSDHSQDLAQMAVALARALGLSREDEETLRFAARLHDLGKIGVPDAILRKPGPLDAAEWVVMKKHPVVGAEIVQPVQRLQRVAPIVRHHQEKFDGTGYPDGLAGAAIPLGARILAVVDAFSAITDDRAYRRGRSRAEAIAEIKRCAGEQFDPRIVEIFLAVIDQVE